jgi:hypothetical protein
VGRRAAPVTVSMTCGVPPSCGSHPHAAAGFQIWPVSGATAENLYPVKSVTWTYPRR